MDQQQQPEVALASGPGERIRTAANLGAAFLDRLAQAPDTTLFLEPDGKRFQPISAREFGEEVVTIARAFAGWGLVRGDRVALMGPNGSFWAAVDWAAQLLGLVVVPLYQGQQPTDLRYLLEDSGPSLICIQGKKALSTLEAVAQDAAYLAPVAVRDPGTRDLSQPFRTWAAFLEAGEPIDRADVRHRNEHVQRSHLATIVYTSGTTGWPKGVELTHGNLLTNLEGILDVLSIQESDRFLSVLPLAHIFERTAGHLLACLAGAEVAYARGPQSIAADLTGAHPTILIAVPRMFQLFHERAEAQAERGGLAARALSWADSEGRFRRLLGRRLLGRGLRRRLGGCIRLLVSGGAPLPAEVGAFFRKAGVPILEGYGQTETSPVVSVNPPEVLRPGTVGPPLPNLEVRVAGDGEILVRGPSVMRGYWGKPEETAQTFDNDWLRTGDTGGLDEAGYLYITDRKKDIIVTSGGKNIPPQRIELRLTAQPLIQQAVVFGDRQPYLGALIVPNWEQVHTQLGADADPDPEGKAVFRLMRATIQAALRDLSSWEQVRRFRVLREPFSEAAGEVTPTLKIRRKVVEEHYPREVASLFSDRGEAEAGPRQAETGG
ncbi:AMP-dependent synthetase/ligase [Thiohalorhabdus methylotrophus]|uniref:Long-chain fatty acid--CoA ligase n=1 Tax=Thiohalorhabdus methylotrophus TaxID=3242694 RepID=A0ABV4TWV7_9GAMM